LFAILGGHYSHSYGYFMMMAFLAPSLFCCPFPHIAPSCHRLSPFFAKGNISNTDFGSLSTALQSWTSHPIPSVIQGLTVKILFLHAVITRFLQSIPGDSPPLSSASTSNPCTFSICLPLFPTRHQFGLSLTKRIP